MKTHHSNHFRGLDIPIQDLNPPESGIGGYQPLNPRTETLKKDSNPHGTRTLPCDILVDHDYHVTVRDGKKLYMDIYRPTTTELVSALICWSPFGKKFNGIASLKLMTPWNLGIPSGRLSGLEKFEAPDPADWVPKGYAIVNVDSRGSGDSEGVCAIMGTQEAEDGYDVIEAIAKLGWCSDLDDMDVYILLRKLDKSGQPVLNLNIPWSDNLPIKTIAEIPEKERTEVILYAGPAGILRASHRAIDESRSMHPHWPFHPHEKEEKVTPGTVVRLDIGIWAMGIEYEAGESIQVEISGHIMGVNNFGTNKHSLNKGRHVVHFGAQHASRVILPFV